MAQKSFLDEDDSPSGGEVFMGCLLILLSIPVGIIARSFVISQMWLWFIVPLGVPAISMAHAFGFAVLIAMITNRESTNKDEKPSIWKSVSHMLGVTILAPALTWFFGWIIHTYFM